MHPIALPLCSILAALQAQPSEQPSYSSDHEMVAFYTKN